MTTIAIIGTGNVGGALGTAAVKAGYDVVFAAKDAAKTRVVAAQAGATAAPSARDAVAGADIVVLAVPYTAALDVAAEIAPVVAGKIVIDATNPLKADYSGLATNGISGAETIQAQVPGARVVKAFNTAFASRQADPTMSGLRADGYVAGDDEDAKATVLGLAEGIGFNPVDVGGLAMARYLEGMAWLNISLQMKNGWSWQAGWKLVGPEGDAS
jgi:predicted dinucleotide-binding enzyme